MDDVTFRSFEGDAKALGFDEVLEREWESLSVLDRHGHPFAVKARVVRGEMWLTVGADTRHLSTPRAGLRPARPPRGSSKVAKPHLLERPGDTFELDPDVLHAERYGPQGATYWVARRNPKAADRP